MVYLVGDRGIAEYVYRTRKKTIDSKIKQICDVEITKNDSIGFSSPYPLDQKYLIPAKISIWTKVLLLEIYVKIKKIITYLLKHRKMGLKNTKNL